MQDGYQCVEAYPESQQTVDDIQAIIGESRNVVTVAAPPQPAPSYMDEDMELADGGERNFMSDY